METSNKVQEFAAKNGIMNCPIMQWQKNYVYLNVWLKIVVIYVKQRFSTIYLLQSGWVKKAFVARTTMLLERGWVM